MNTMHIALHTIQSIGIIYVLWCSIEIYVDLLNKFYIFEFKFYIYKKKVVIVWNENNNKNNKIKSKL